METKRNHYLKHICTLRTEKGRKKSMSKQLTLNRVQRNMVPQRDNHGISRQGLCKYWLWNLKERIMSTWSLSAWACLPPRWSRGQPAACCSCMCWTSNCSPPAVYSGSGSRCLPSGLPQGSAPGHCPSSPD